MSNYFKVPGDLNKESNNNSFFYTPNDLDSSANKTVSSAEEINKFISEVATGKRSEGTRFFLWLYHCDREYFWL